MELRWVCLCRAEPHACGLAAGVRLSRTPSLISTGLHEPMRPISPNSSVAEETGTQASCPGTAEASPLLAVCEWVLSPCSRFMLRRIPFAKSTPSGGSSASCAHACHPLD